jgi:hypothetical protein
MGLGTVQPVSIYLVIVMPPLLTFVGWVIYQALRDDSKPKEESPRV